MNKKRVPFSIKLIYWFTNVIMGLLGLVFLVVIVVNILLYTGSFGNNLQLHMTLPIKVDIIESGTLEIDDELVKVELVDATPKIHFFNTPDFIAKKVGVTLFFVLAWVIFQTWTFRIFIINVKDGDVFTFRNISLLKRMAYAFAEIYFYAMYHFVAKNLRFENVEITDDIPEFGGLLFIALFTWVLAHIFKTGLDLRQETELTI